MTTKPIFLQIINQIIHIYINDNSSFYCNAISDILGFIDSVAASYAGCRLCILGDLNFECDIYNKGYLLFSDLANEYGLECCDNLNSSSVCYTYHHDTLGHRSLIDHVFIEADLKGYVTN